MQLVDEVLRAGIGAKNDASERPLVEAATGGDAQAFAVLYDRHVERVYRYAYYLVANRPDAEDLTQQVFLQAWRAIGRYRRTGASFAAWLLMIAHNLAMSHFRRKKEVTQLEFEPAAGERWTDPAEELLAEHSRQMVRNAVLRLKPDFQQVILMRFVEHLEYADIARILGKSEGNVRVIQHRALQELRRLLTPEVKS